MSAGELQERNRLFGGGRAETLGELVAWCGGLLARADVAAATRLAVLSTEPRLLLAAAATFHARGADGALVSASGAAPDTAVELRERGFTVLEGDGASAPRALPAARPEPARPGTITLLTSGTTGTPKLVTHTWDSLRTLRGLPEGAAPAPRRWLLTYLPGTYAWFQMATLWMFTPGQDLVAGAPAGAAPEEIWDAGVAAGCDAVSATPSFWRYLLATRARADLERAPLAQITLGGEPVRQDLLDRLRALYPQARLTHIYASAEVGAAIVVHDGREGFPASWLADGGPGRCRLRCSDGMLEVASPYAAASAAGGWHPTGDRVEIVDERAVVVGRAAGDLINVGGRKASRAAIEAALSSSPLVLWCRVSGKAAPLVGSLVAAEVVLAPEARDLAGERVERELAAHCAARALPDWMVPRLWRIRAEVPLAATMKSAVDA